ncbi:hypothetical protein [Allorhizocola rhizosphaerae]|uniref:hypothetical protein n=1 Tax=Allorhizocola rhizosphaerae TaxID=1872709 RepID=UPI000E3BBD10|nr:hypothetical protein [Allorhizocola rhizosphaerae]
MGESYPFLIIGGGCMLFATVMILLLIVLGRKSSRRERERLQRVHEWAARHGWTVTAEPGIDWAQLPRGERSSVSLLLSTTMYGRHVSVAEYSYVTESMADSKGSRSTTTHRLIVAAVRFDAAYPPVAVEVRGAVSRFGRQVFGDNAAATGHDPFDRAFRIQTKDPQWARTLFGPTLIAEHLAGRIPVWSLAGHDLLTWQRGAIEDPDQIPMLVTPLLRVADLLGH